MPLMHYLPLIIVLTAGILISIKTEKLTTLGAITGGIAALLTFAGAGYTGLIMLSAFFVFGTTATAWKKKEKLQFKSVDDRSSKRKASQVLANGGIAAITGLLICILPDREEMLRLMMAASLASAMADTLSSELGMIYGRRFYNVITFKRDKKGLDGVISMEGLLIGIVGSAIIALIYSYGFGWDTRILFIIIAGTIGNLSDSVLGAWLERKHYIGNDTVNFLNTLIAALSIWLFVAF